MTVISGFLDGLRPTERMLPSEWSDKYRFLSAKAAAEPGRWRTSRTPYLREVMDRCGARDPAREIIIMKGAQLGFTEAGFNIICYFIDIDPSPIMYTMPTVETIKRNSKLRVDPMISDTPRIAEKIQPARKRDSGNTTFQKDFPGGTLILAGANSAAGLRSVPVRVLILDEIDAYPQDLDGEGSPIELATARTRTFANRKILKFSTPTVHGISVVESELEKTSHRKYFVPCPFCDHMQFLTWDNVRYEKNAQGEAENAVYVCEKCEKEIEERHKPQMLTGGHWKDTQPEKASRTKYGYHINSLYSPLGWYSWLDAANDWIKAQGKPEKLKVFVNTVLGETWKEKGEVPEWENLKNRALDYHTNTVNNEVAIITAGVDVQKDRLELELVGWCSGKITYSIDYRVIPGDTSGPDPWRKLGILLNETWTRPDGIVLPLSKIAIDTGYRASEVYAFCRKYLASGKVMAVKGSDTQPTILSQPRPVDRRGKKGKAIAGGLRLWMVGVSMIKQEIYGNLNLPIKEGNIPEGYCFFPKQYDEHFYKMLCAEEYRVKIVKGFRRYEWVKVYERNEALDCRVYARAAVSVLGADRWTPADWKALITPPPTTSKKKRKSSFWD